MNALSREGAKPTYQSLMDIYSAVVRLARTIKRDFDLFDTRPFADLSYAAVETAERLVANR